MDATSNKKYETLPSHVRRMSDGGMACLHCGGTVGTDGYAKGGEVEPPKEDASSDKDKHKRALFMLALRRK